MNRFTLIHCEATDVRGRNLGSTRLDAGDVEDRLVHVLEETALCSIATVTPDGAAHINTAYYAYSDALELFFLSHPLSIHGQNLVRNPSIAATVFSSAQRWTNPGRGVQLFGTAAQVPRSAEEGADRCYGRRFPAYYEWKDSLAEGDLAREYCLYRITVSAVTILDEEALGDAVFVRAIVARTSSGPECTNAP